MSDHIRLEDGTTWHSGQFLGETRLLLNVYCDCCTQTQIIAIYHVTPEKVTFLKEWRIRQQDYWAGNPIQKITAGINDFLYARFGDLFSERGLMDRRAVEVS